MVTEVRDPDEFCEAVGPRLAGSLTLYCGDRGAGEELAQEALARALERWAHVGVMASPEAWVYRVGLNLARSRFRRRAAERRGLRRLASQTSGVQEAEDSATAVTVRRLVAELPPRQRAAVVARFYGGLSVDEAAEVLDCAPGTVRALTHQALTRLREQGLDATDDDDVDAPEGAPDDEVMPDAAAP